nr:DNA-directed DNA polymerase [Tanacetum cinerariifolium]
MSVSSISEAMQPTFKGRLEKACNKISFLKTPARETNPADQVCLSRGDVYNDPCLLRFYQNNDTPPWGNSKRKEKGEDGPEWTVRSTFENELANFMLEKKSHAKGIGDMLDQHLVEPLELKALENRLKPSSFEPPKLELKELPEHLEYAFLQENNQLLVVNSSALSTVKKARLLKVLWNHKGAIAWSITDIKRINSSFCTHKILLEDEFKPSVQPQRRINPNIKEVVKKEVTKLFDAGLIYPISDSPWVSLVQVVQKREK